MSGHSKWSTIKHKKAINDAKRAKIFTRLAKAVTVAAQNGDGNPETNLKLKFAIEQARAQNVPKENIERAIKRGTGELSDGAKLEEVTYEGYGPNNTALIITATTDNTNRTVSEIRHLLGKYGGKFVPSGSVSFQFAHVGQLLVSLEGKDRDEAELAAIDAGATDVDGEDDSLIVTTDASGLHSTKSALEKAGYTIAESRLTYLPTQPLTLSDAEQKAFDSLVEALDGHDDVDEVFHNVTSDQNEE